MRKKFKGEFLFGKQKVIKLWFKQHLEENTALYTQFISVLDKLKSKTDKFCLYFTKESLKRVESNLQGL